MLPVLVLLVGLPGSGKCTIAAALAARLAQEGREVGVLDNHYAANPILALVAQDGAAALPADVWARVAQVRTAVLDTVADLSPRDWSFVFTADLGDAAEDVAFVQRIEAIATERGANFEIVRLVCELKELKRPSPRRLAVLDSSSSPKRMPWSGTRLACRRCRTGPPSPWTSRH